MITFDCASPFLATANGQIYITTETENRKKWVYRMVPSIDELKYANDTRNFRDGVLADGIFKTFTDSPLTKSIKINDVCHYAVGDVNKVGGPKILKGEIDREIHLAGIALVMLYRWVITYGVILMLYKKLIDSMTTVLFLICLCKNSLIE